MFFVKSMFLTLTQQIFQKVNICNEYTRDMLAGSWVKVGNMRHPKLHFFSYFSTNKA